MIIEILCLIWGCIWMIGLIYLVHYHNQEVLKYEQKIADLMNASNHRNLDAMNNPYLELQLHEWRL